MNQEQYKALGLRLGNEEYRDRHGPRHMLEIDEDGHCGYKAMCLSMCYDENYRIAPPITFQAMRHDLAEHMRPNLFGI